MGAEGTVAGDGRPAVNGRADGDVAAAAGAARERILDTIGERAGEIAKLILARMSEELLDYGDLADPVRADVFTNLLSFIEDFVARGRGGSPEREADRIEHYRRSARRRPYQGITIQAVLFAHRIIEEEVWREVSELASDDDGRRAAIELAGNLMDQLYAPTAMAEAYLDEQIGAANDRAVMRRDLLESLIGERSSPDETDRLCRSMGIRLLERNAVVLIQARDRLGLSREKLRAAFEHCQHVLQSSDGATLTGLREAQVVALYPLADATGLPRLNEQASLLATSLDDFVVGLSRVHEGVGLIATGYQEARQAVEIALARTETQVAVTFESIVLERMLRSSPYAGELVDDTIRPLREYDRARPAALVATLRAYFESGFSLTRSAEMLHVQPNTIAYRLTRIAQVTGRDYSDPDDLLVLVLGLKASEIGQ